MSKKDYVMLAGVVKARHDEIVNPVSIFDAANLTAHLDELQKIAESMADIFSQDNPRFDRSRFLKACGVS